MTLLWIFSTNSSAALGNVKYSVFMYENTTKQAEFTSVGMGHLTSRHYETFGELRPHQKVCLISANRRKK